jgi:hypothetical protein
MNFKSFKMLDISTGHIERNDVDLLELEEWCSALPFMCLSYPEGFILSLGAVENVPDACARLSSSFQTIVRLAKEQGYDFINFDRDGEVYPELKTFDW